MKWGGKKAEEKEKQKRCIIATFMRTKIEPHKGSFFFAKNTVPFMNRYERRKVMDELKIKTDFMKGIIAKIIAKKMRKKFGCDVNIRINDLQFQADNGKIVLHTSVDGEMTNENFMKLIKNVGLD